MGKAMGHPSASFYRGQRPWMALELCQRWTVGMGHA
jgi:hypothetical protein